MATIITGTKDLTVAQTKKNVSQAMRWKPIFDRMIEEGSDSIVPFSVLQTTRPVRKASAAKLQCRQALSMLTQKLGEPYISLTRYTKITASRDHVYVLWNKEPPKMKEPPEVKLTIDPINNHLTIVSTRSKEEIIEEHTKVKMELDEDRKRKVFHANLPLGLRQLATFIKGTSVDTEMTRHVPRPMTDEEKTYMDTLSQKYNGFYVENLHDKEVTAYKIQ